MITAEAVIARLPLIHRDEIPLRLTRIELTRPADAISAADHFVPVRDPANGAANGKITVNIEVGNAEGFQNNARVEVDIGDRASFSMKYSS